MESGVIALAHSFHWFFTIVDMDKYLSGAVELPIVDTNMNVSIHEDNYGALVLEDNLPLQFNPHIKYSSSKTIWF